MSYSETSLSNMALGHCGIGVAIGDYDNEVSAEANACRRYFDQCRDVIFRMRRWSFSCRLISLTDLGVDDTNYEDIWAYRYQFPADAIRLNYIINPAMRQPGHNEDKVPYQIVDKNDSGSPGKVVLCDQETAIADCNIKITNVQLWPADFVEAFTLLLALRIAPSLKVDARIMQSLQQQWQLFLQNAINSIDSESHPDPNPVSQFQSVRS